MQADSSRLAGVTEGTVLAGKYRIEKILGQGGMGIVVAARHLQLDQRVAIKFLLREALHDRDAVGRFAREAQAASRIRSEHVARVTDVGALENGAPYLVMEYLEGRDLAAMVAERGPLPVDEVTELVLQACEAIAEAHVLGIVHRDLEPANLFCIRRSDGLPAVKVLDFGISKVTGFGASGRDLLATGTVAVLGSPLYMSPEQLASAKGVDTRTDIWALGVILYELLTARTPFTGESFPELCIRITTAPPLPIREARGGLPVGLEKVIARCLEKDRAMRFPNVAELAAALAPFAPVRARGSAERAHRVIEAAGLSARGTAPAPPSVSAGAMSGPAGTFSSWGRTGRGEARPGKGAAAILVVSAVAALGVGGVILARRAAAPSATEPAISGATALAPAVPSALPLAAIASAASPPPAAPGPAPVIDAGAPTTHEPVLAAREPAAEEPRAPAANRGSSRKTSAPRLQATTGTPATATPAPLSSPPGAPAPASSPPPAPAAAPSHEEPADPFGGRR